MIPITRFAPSPTGYLHIGGARTALYNWLHTRKFGGKFYLRIEDTDKIRSTQSAIDAIINGLNWLGLDWDGDIILQSKNVFRHKEVAEELIRIGKAYRCYMTQEEINEMREKFGKVISPWRNINIADADNIHVHSILNMNEEETNEMHNNRYQYKDLQYQYKDLEYKQYTIRLKVDLNSISGINDIIKGRVEVNNNELDDMILVRSDGTPTYMLAVVVDDHDAGINTIIRGDDHFTNTFRQLQIYNAMGWNIPQYAHIPMINAEDGKKMSKRHGAIGIDQYKNMGYLPDTMINYLLRLGWGGDGMTEIYSRDESISSFELHKVSSSPARFDIQKLNNLNGHYIRKTDNKLLFSLIYPLIIEKLNLIDIKYNFELDEKMLLKGIDISKQRVSTILELSDICMIYFYKKNPIDDKCQQVLSKITVGLVDDIKKYLLNLKEWNCLKINDTIEIIAEQKSIKKNEIMSLLRALIIGTFKSPSVSEVMEVIGKEKSINRIIQTMDSIIT
ncbi:glutamate--tRNA ligase [Lyticum sinuosum]|uniref:Glutamate--tRNA ligase n=1 Tax=Lyticum sinuosum TaxID=1332059 RepID=A0AAE4VKK5_9RICK|nr:glutamate--tRNA ligase [Lyticum sinuosum]MDZ5761255.1 Glutamate--tRNA ligase [Lyticum sinuosum]